MFHLIIMLSDMTSHFQEGGLYVRPASSARIKFNVHGCPRRRRWPAELVLQLLIHSTFRSCCGRPCMDEAKPFLALPLLLGGFNFTIQPLFANFL